MKAIDFTVAKENLREDTIEIYTRLYEDSNKEDLTFEELQGGNINIICLVANRNDEDKWIIFRHFNMKGDLKPTDEKRTSEETSRDRQTDENEECRSIFKLLSDREGEIRVMNELSKHRLCQKVLVKWNNGIAYKYTPGVVCNGKQMLTEEFLQEISIKLAKIHSLKVDQPDIGFKTHFERIEMQTGPVMKEVDKSVQEAIEQVDVWPYKDFPKLKHLKEVQNEILERLYALGLKESELRLCHNDMNSNNIIFNEKAEKLSQFGLIDFEMAMLNYPPLEFGYLFMCFTGYFLYGFQPELFPDQDYRLKFIRSYLKERNRLERKLVLGEDFEKQVEWLYHTSNLSALHNFLLIIYSFPSLDFRKDVFRNPDLDKLVKDKPYYFGETALKIYEFFVMLDADVKKQVDEYLERRSLS